jgi:DNA-binding GntR family transcriptional regulator
MAKLEDVSIKTTIYKYIRDLILTNILKQGEKIPEGDIAKALNVSKTPVREAIRRLALEGLIDSEPNKSSTVRVLDESTIKDLACVRWQHEKLNVPLVIYNASNKDFDELEEIAHQCIEYNNSGDLNMRNKTDGRFHLKLYEIGGNQVLVELQKKMELLVQLWQAASISTTNVKSEYLNQHLELVDIFRRRDCKAALDLLYKHYCVSYGIDIESLIPKV